MKQYNITGQILEIYRLLIDKKEKNLARDLAVAIVTATLIAEETARLPYGTFLLALVGKMNDEVEDAEKRGLFARKENGNASINKV